MSGGFAFISDVSNSMCGVCRSLHEKTVQYAYGCSVCCDNNLTPYLSKLSIFPTTIKDAFYISKNVINVGTICKIFELLCQEGPGKILLMVLYSPTRWSSVNYMFTRILNVRSVFLEINHELHAERDKWAVDPDYQLPLHSEKISQSIDFPT